MRKNAKTISLGVLIISFGFLISVVVLNFLMGFWVEGVKEAGFEGSFDDFREHLNSTIWRSYPRLAFYAALSVSWFIGGYYVSKNAERNRVLSSGVAGIFAGMVFFFHWLAFLVLVFFSVLGGIIGLPESNKELQRTAESGR